MKVVGIDARCSKRRRRRGEVVVIAGRFRRRTGIDGRWGLNVLRGGEVEAGGIDAGGFG